MKERKTAMELGRDLPSLRWIPVKSRLPEDGEPVLMHCLMKPWFYGDNVSTWMQLGFFEGGHFHADHNAWDETCVTHWMPVTPLPTENLK